MFRERGNVDNFSENVKYGNKNKNMVIYHKEKKG